MPAALTGVDHSDAVTNNIIEAWHSYVKVNFIKPYKRTLKGRRLDWLVQLLLTDVEKALWRGPAVARAH